MEGLQDLPPIHKSHHFTTPPEMHNQVIAFSSEHPIRDCVKLSDLLELQGVSVSFRTVQNILIKHGLGQNYDQLLELERRHLGKGLELTAEHVHSLGKANLASESGTSRVPGWESCSALTSSAWEPSRVLAGYISMLWSTPSAICIPANSQKPRPYCLYNDVLPFYRERGLPVTTVLTDNGWELCGRGMHPHELYLALNDIESRTTRIRTSQTNSFVECFNRRMKEEGKHPQNQY